MIKKLSILFLSLLTPLANLIYSQNYLLSSDSIRQSSYSEWINENEIVYTSEGCLIRKNILTLNERNVLSRKGYISKPKLSSDKRFLAVRNQDSVFIFSTINFDIVDRRLIADIDEFRGPGWDLLDSTIIKGKKDFLWTSISRKGKIAHIKRSKNWFGNNDLYIDSINIENEPGITWIFSPYASPIEWSSDGRRLYFISRRTGWSKIYSVDENGKNLRQETYGEGDDRDFEILSDGSILFVSNRENRLAWSLWHKKKGFPARRLFGKNGFVKGISYNGKNKVALLYSSPLVPFEQYIYELETESAYKVSSFTPSSLLDMTIKIECKSFSSNGVEIEGVLSKPSKDIDMKGVIIDLHGGPTMQSALNWDNKRNFLVLNNFVVFQMNYIGSTGYGRNFEEMNKYAIGENETDDIVNAVSFLKSLGFKNFGIMGSSYGGYLTNLVCGKNPKIFDAAVSWYGITDYQTLLESENLNKTVFYFFKDRLGSFNKNIELYYRSSPINYAANFLTPILLIHGTDDYVVPFNQSEMLYKKLTGLNKTVEFISYPGQGHGWNNSEIRNDAYTKTVEWFDRYINERN